jgi:hypothetical protein
MAVKDQPQLRLVVSKDEESTGSAGGYRSGRNACLETPETRSTVNTRSAGTFPERRHFCTAWYRTPHLAANEPSPPAPSIASATGPLSTNDSGVMNVSMQPIVASGQQPIRAVPGRTMQLMVVRNKIEARKEFAKNLNVELDLQKVPRRGRAGWLQAKIGKIVSRESCRKWLAGEDMPDQGNLSVLITALGINEQKLRVGQWSPPPGAHDERLSLITKKWPHLPSKAQDAIMAMLDALPETQGIDNADRSRVKGSRGSR